MVTKNLIEAVHTIRQALKKYRLWKFNNFGDSKNAIKWAKRRGEDPWRLAFILREIWGVGFAPMIVVYSHVERETIKQIKLQILWRHREQV